MKVILVQDVDGLGKAGQAVEAADGYVRHYLLPNRLAEPFTPGAERRWSELRRAESRRIERERLHAESVFRQLNGVRLVVRVRTGQGGRAFGAVTARDVAERIRETLGVTLDKRHVLLPGPIKSLGEYSVKVDLHPGPTASLTLTVEEAGR